MRSNLFEGLERGKPSKPLADQELYECRYGFTKIYAYSFIGGVTREVLKTALGEQLYKTQPDACWDSYKVTTNSAIVLSKVSPFFDLFCSTKLAEPLLIVKDCYNFPPSAEISGKIYASQIYTDVLRYSDPNSLSGAFWVAIDNIYNEATIADLKKAQDAIKAIVENHRELAKHLTTWTKDPSIDDLALKKAIRTAFRTALDTEVGKSIRKMLETGQELNMFKWKSITEIHVSEKQGDDDSYILCKFAAKP